MHKRDLAPPQGFRLERLIGGGSQAVVFEATQISLDRRVALKLFVSEPARGDRLMWPEHPRVVSLYAGGTCEYGYFVAMQLIRGASLAQLVEKRRLKRAGVNRVLGDVSEALEAAHRAGIVHGAVTAGNVLVDKSGRGFLSDFGLGSPGATPESDRAALAALAPTRVPPPRLRRCAALLASR